MNIALRQFLIFAPFAISGCATVAPDSVPWLLHRREIEKAPWWGKPRFNMETSAMFAPQKSGDILTPNMQGTVGVPVGRHFGIDAGFGFFPPDFKIALPVSSDNVVVYPFCALAMRDSTLLPIKHWRYDPGMEIGILFNPNLAVRLTVGRMRTSPFKLGGESSFQPYELSSNYIAVTAEPISHEREGSILGQFSFGISNGPETGTSFFLRLGVNMASTPALFR